MITINKLRKRIRNAQGDHEALFDNFRLNISAGTVIVLLGESGCGKTTLLKILVGAEGFESGDVTLDGRKPAKACAEGLVGFAEQDPTLLPWRTVRQNVLLQFELKRKAPDADRMARLLTMVGLMDRQEVRAGKLSGGERKRLGFVRALIDTAAVILLDEPFSSCDLKTRMSMYDSLGAFYREFVLNSPRTLVIVTHSIEEAALLGMRAAILKGGRPCTLFEEVDLNSEPLPSSAMSSSSPFNASFEANVRMLRESCLKAWASHVSPTLDPE